MIGAIPVLVSDGGAVWTGRSRHEALLWDQASAVLVIIIHA